MLWYDDRKRKEPDLMLSDATPQVANLPSQVSIATATGRCVQKYTCSESAASSCGYAPGTRSVRYSERLVLLHFSLAVPGMRRRGMYVR
jgi:hypothetical protein